MRERELARSIVGELIWLAATACVLLDGRWFSHHMPPLQTGPPTTLHGVEVAYVWRIPHSIELVF
ncbi:MAG TPA: hypothetical protein VGX23_09970 [Actinocrinis sp.]|nr:hypothetical protein [Actinocrinis sp.]